MTLTYWIDDGLMALFFLMVGLEIKRELLVGELSSIQKASFPFIAAMGGMLIPALTYVAFNPDNPMGFGVPMATDIAFALGILMIVLFTWLASHFNLVKKPDNISWMEVVAVGLLAGIGFTMSIFITHLAFLDESVIAAVKLGVFIASFIAAVIGVVLILKATKDKVVP